MKKQVIRLTESDLHKIIKESVKKILKESDTGNFDDFYGGEENQAQPQMQQQPQEQQVISKLLSLGVRDITNAYKNAYSNTYGGGEDYDDERYDYVKPEMAKQFLSATGAQRLMKKGYIYQWFIQIGDRTLCSRHNFDDEDYAQENCDKYINLIEKAGLSCDANVDVISFENGNYIMDTVLYREDFGDGQPFWMD